MRGIIDVFLKDRIRSVVMSALAVLAVVGFAAVTRPYMAYADVITMEDLGSASPVYEYLYQQLMAKETEIDMSQFNILLDESDSYAEYCARLIYGAVLEEYADIAWSSECTVEMSEGEGGWYLKTFHMTYVEDEYDMDAFYAARDEALALITPEMTDIQKALVLHDYLVSKTAYDSWGHEGGGARRNDYKAYGALVEHLAVCDGLSLAYKYLCNQAGLECYCTSSETIQHGWNTVVIDGEAYEVDLTADNPCYDMLGRVWHECAFVSETKAKEWPGHMEDRNVHSYVGTIDLPATSTKYEDAFWSSIKTPIYYYKGNYYYTVEKTLPGTAIRSAIVTRPADLTGSEQGIHNIFGVKDEIRAAYPWAEGYIVKISDDRIYFATMTTYSSMDLAGNDCRDEYVIDTGDLIIYGAAELDGQVYYTLGNEYFPSGRETYIPLSEEDRVYFPEVTEAPAEPEITEEPSVTEAASVTAEPEVTKEPAVTATVDDSGSENMGHASEGSKSGWTADLSLCIIVGCVGVLLIVASTIAIISIKKMKN